MSYQALVFDFFGVICSEVAPFWLARYFSAAEAGDLKGGLIHAADRGEISQAEMFEALGEAAGVAAETVLSDWNSLARIDPEMVELVRDARKRARVALLTNCPSPFVRSLLRAHRLEPLFEHIIVSSEVMAAKPEPVIYEMMLRQLGLPPAYVAMIDDNPVNVVAAKGAGMAGLLFLSAEQCRRDILGIKPTAL